MGGGTPARDTGRRLGAAPAASRRELKGQSPAGPGRFFEGSPEGALLGRAPAPGPGPRGFAVPRGGPWHQPCPGPPPPLTVAGPAGWREGVRLGLRPRAGAGVSQRGELKPAPVR